MTKDLHFLLMRCFHFSNKALVQATAAIGLLPGQPKILECLLEEDGLSPNVIGTRCAIDKSTMTGLLRKMEEQGLVVRRAHERDRRAVQIWLTPEGRAHAQAVETLAAQVDASATARLSAEEVETLDALLKKIILSFEEASIRE